jgi:hypothetical protein
MNISIYYHPETRQWMHHDFIQYLRWGNNQVKIAFSGDASAKELPFVVRKNQNKAGPLIGLLTIKGKKGLPFAGNPRIFQRIQELLQNVGGVSIVFTPEGLQKERLNGFVYHPPTKKWVKVTTPLPDLVYNRVPFRKLEKSHLVQHTMEFFKNVHIPLFNPHFFEKWATFQALRQSEMMIRYLPETQLIVNREILTEMLDKHHKIYVKPAEGCKGKGIFTICQERTKRIYDVQDINKCQTYFSLEDLWNERLFGKTTYIGQEAVSPDIWEGLRYDLRIFVHYQSSKYVISGIGVRAAPSHHIVTHVPNGGILLSFDLIKNRFDYHSLTHLVHECGLHLSKAFGFVGEFSMDIGISENKELYIYEINSKPMIFDEANIQEQGLQHLICTFLEKSGYHKPDFLLKSANKSTLLPLH